jgi:hypothetical protein
VWSRRSRRGTNGFGLSFQVDEILERLASAKPADEPTVA